MADACLSVNRAMPDGGAYAARDPLEASAFERWDCPSRAVARRWATVRCRCCRHASGERHGPAPPRHRGTRHDSGRSAPRTPGRGHRTAAARRGLRSHEVGDRRYRSGDGGLAETTTRNSPWPSGRVPDGALPAFVDSSALVAMLDADDARHAQASRIRDHLVDGARRGSRTLITHQALVVETSAVPARRFGMRAQPDLFQNLLWRVRIARINADQQGSPRSAAFLLESRRKRSLADCLSFAVMRSGRIRHAFAFDADFDERGFLPPPEPARLTAGGLRGPGFEPLTPRNGSSAPSGRSGAGRGAASPASGGRGRCEHRCSLATPD